MSIVSFQEISVAFGGPLLLDKLSFQLEAKDRVALLGRNGVGKTTFMKVMSGDVTPTAGIVSLQKGLSVSLLSQEAPKEITGTVFEVVLSGMGGRAQLLGEYHHVAHQMSTDHSPELLAKLDRLQSELDRTQAWELDNEVEQVLEKMKLHGDDDFTLLSGGQKRRALLARALVLKPDLLLLDEPTNHLDIDTIDWLEGMLKDYPGTVFFVTHDRQFMSHVASRIVELDRGRVMSWACDYKTFLERKEQALANEAVLAAKFDKRLAQEETWVRQGVKARRCRNEGRVKALELMRAKNRERRRAEGMARMRLQDAESSGHMVIKASRLGCSYDDLCLVRDFSTNIMRGDKIGVIGPNGCGKSTFLRVLLGLQEPSKGTVRFGTELQIAYFDQMRETLDDEKTVMENISGASDTILINGKPRHIIGYLEDFLFSADRARTPVKVLSGGERNRLLLARLFTRPANLLVMDEPTNDLDIETLEILEATLVGYEGTLILVSHDRAFLNNVVTSTIVFEGQGAVNEYPGGYDDWLMQRAKGPLPPVVTETKAAPKLVPVLLAPALKLSFKEQRELDKMPDLIARLENEQEELCAQLGDSTFYKKDPAAINTARARSEVVALEIAAAYRRWEELEKKA